MTFGWFLVSLVMAPGWRRGRRLGHFPNALFNYYPLALPVRTCNLHTLSPSGNSIGEAINVLSKRRNNRPWWRERDNRWMIEASGFAMNLKQGSLFPQQLLQFPVFMLRVHSKSPNWKNFDVAFPSLFSNLLIYHLVLRGEVLDWPPLPPNITSMFLVQSILKIDFKYRHNLKNLPPRFQTSRN